MVREDIGARLRIARQQRGLSLRALAQSLGVSASLISQIETGKTQPSVSTLYAIVTHLGISIDDLLGVESPAGSSPQTASAPGGAHSPEQHPAFAASAPHPATAIVQSAADNAVLEMENGVRWERLAAGNGPADALLVTYEPGASSSIEGRLMRHAGIEYAYLLEGELTLQIEFDTHVLRPGDSLHFDSVLPHLYSNRTSAIARGIWFVVGRRQPAPPLGHGDSDADGGAAASSPLASAVDVLQRLDGLAR